MPLSFRFTVILRVPTILYSEILIKFYSTHEVSMGKQNILHRFETSKFILNELEKLAQDLHLLTVFSYLKIKLM